MKSGFNGLHYVKANGQTVSGLYIAPKESVIIHDIKLGKPYMPLKKKKKGRNPVKGLDGIEGIGSGKKRMSICNGLNRGSNFTLT